MDAMESLIIQREISWSTPQPYQPSAFERIADSNNKKLNMEERIKARYRESLQSQYFQYYDNELTQTQDQLSSQYQMHMKRLFDSGIVVDNVPLSARRGSMQRHRQQGSRRRSSSSSRESSHHNPQDSNSYSNKRGVTTDGSDANNSDADTVMSKCTTSLIADLKEYISKI